MILDEEELESWGRRIGRSVETPAFFALTGPLGAGKSVLARAIARGAGVEGSLPSPTFNLLFRYPSSRGVEVVHLDLYRIQSPAELGELGWDDLGAPNEIVVVEWPERAAGLLPDDRWEVILDHVAGEPLLRSLDLRRCGRPPELPQAEAGERPCAEGRA